MTSLLKILAAAFLAALFLAACGNDDGAPQNAPAPETPAAETPADQSAPAAGQPADAETEQPLATVNGVPIPRYIFEYQVVLAESNRMIFDQAAPDEAGGEAPKADDAADTAFRVEVLDNLIDLDLACQEAMRLGYGPKPGEVDEAYEKLKGDFDDPDQIHEALSQFGATEAELKSQMARNLALNKWQEALVAKAGITDEAAREFYEAHKAEMRHGEMAELSGIFISVPPGSDQAARDKGRARAEAALAALKGGQKFEEVAGEFSDDPTTPENDGALGWVEIGQVMPELEKVVFQLKPGQVSGIVESPLGLHIFKVTGRKEAGAQPFEEAKAGIVDTLAGDKMVAEIEARIKELRRDAKIEISDPDLKKAYDEVQKDES